MLSKLINWLYSRKDCKLDKYFNLMDNKLENISEQCELIKSKLSEEIKELNYQVDTYKSMIDAIANAIPDMLWFKDVDGKYVYANQAIKDGLLLDNDVIGKTDIELALQAKMTYGDENHTFGEKCKNSDIVVLNTLNKQKFMESGKVKGEMLYLEVYKAPFMINGKLVGVVGTGRDMTEYKKLLDNHECPACDIFKLHEFEPDDI